MRIIASFLPNSLLRIHSLALGLYCASAVAQTNGVVRELYARLPGSSIPDLTNSVNFPSNPDAMFIESAFEAPVNFSDNYGQRMRALLCPPVTGAYTFWISSDDNSVLYLSTDETPGHKAAVAYESTWNNSRQYNLYASQKSAAVNLSAGKRYYIEALQKEGGGGDNLAVAWQKPGDPAPADGAPPIPGAYLVPYGLGPPVIAVQPASISVVEGGSAGFSVQLAQKLGAVYQWSRDGLQIPGATNAWHTVSPATLADNGSAFRCLITNFYGWTNSAAAILTVLPDVTSPTLVSAGGLGDPRIVTIVFSEPVEPADATNTANYSISGGVSVLAASFGLDSRTIVLTVSSLAPHITYVLTVNNVRDCAAAPNTILPNTQQSFSIDGSPLDIALLRPYPEPISASSRHGPIIFSEIMYHPPPRPDGKNLEFVELYNSNPFSEDISGFRLTGQVEFTFPTNTVIAGRSFLAVAAAPADLLSVWGAMNLQGPYTNSLSNRSGTLRLRNRQGGILLEVNYSSEPPWPAAADGAGHSLVLGWPSLGEGNPVAWTASAVIGGSPGKMEASQQNAYRTVLINEVLAHTDPPDYDFIELYNYSSSPVNISGCTLSDDPATNKFRFPSTTIIEPQGFIAVDETQLGFRLDAAGETIYFKDPPGTRVLDSFKFGAQQNGVSFGRYPDGAKDLSRLQNKTPGSSNARPRVADVVINEIMYAPFSGQDDDQYVELHNRTDSPVDVSRWSFEDGVGYTVPGGVVIPAHGYLVVARNAAHLMTNYPNLTGGNTLGNFSGSLARGGERLALGMPDEIIGTNAAGTRFTNFIHIVVDEVTFGTGGRWGNWAHGGGSSLELIDPRGDHRLPPNWADSDETAKSGWTTVEVTDVLDNGNGAADSLQIIMLGPGECLVDDVEVFAAGGANRVGNSGFETGLGGWVAQGNHEDSSWEAGQGYNSAHCLHVRAADHGDAGANRIRTSLTSALNPGQTATIRAKVRWLAGCPEILLRLRGNWLEATGSMLRTTAFGTPGAANSRALPNAGPAITEVRHSPVLPGAGQSVTIIARVDDPDGLAGLFLNYRVDPATNYTVVSMANNGAGLFSAKLPGQPSGTLVAFYLEALDNHAPRAAAHFPNDAPSRDCLVRWGDPGQGGTFGTYRLWMTQATFNRWSAREKLSNKPLDCTFIYGPSRVIYNVGGQYSGSPWHAPGYDSPTGNVCDYLLTFPGDDRLLGETDATLQWPGNGGGDNTYQREQTAYWIAEQMGLPYCYRRSVNLFINGSRRAELFEDVQQPNGDMSDEYYPNGTGGDLHKVQIWFEFDDAASTFTAAGATLGNVTTTGGRKDSAFYRWTFAKRAIHGSANNYANLFALVDAANYPGLGAAYRRQLEAKVDTDNWLKTYAVEHIVGNSDCFAYGGGQNMYTYKPTGDTWKMLIWDIDFAFAAQPPDSDPFQGIGRSNGIDLGEPAYARRYWQCLQDLANGPLNGTKLNSLVDSKYSAMLANGRTVDSPSTIKTYVSQRRAYLLNFIATNVPSGFSITLNGGAGFSTGQNLVSLQGTAPIDVRTITFNGVVFPVTWTSITRWAAQVALASGPNPLLVQGWDAASNAVSGATAAITITNTAAAELPQDNLVINEIMYRPAAPEAAFVEIHNRSTVSAFDLSGYRLDGVDFLFPGGSVVAPDGFLVVASNTNGFWDAYGTATPVAGEFGGKLENGGETLQFIQPGPTPAQDVVIDEVRYDSEAPWPAAANGDGASLQLIDESQDNNRVANWAAVPASSGPAGPQWRYVVAPGTASSSTLYIYLQSAGETWIDDLKIVAGTVAESGPNLLADGDFEAGFPGPWVVSANLAGSGLSTSLKHGGASSLHLVASSGGTTRASSIYQDLSPALTLNAPYTLSFWVLENTNGGMLTLRLSNSGIITNVNLLPGAGAVSLARCTPGAANSVRSSLPRLPTLWLNEVLPDNVTGATDRFGHHHPWAELYNSGPTNIGLNGIFLANNYSNLLQWPFPSGANLAAGQRALVWLDGNPGESVLSELHTGFTTAPGSGSLVLVSTNGNQPNILDYLNYKLTQPDRSYGAFPDGSPGHRQVFYYPTPGSSNNPASPPLSLLINEWMADNKTTVADPADNDFEDWFEIYNAGDTPADPTGFYLGQSLTNRTKFLIPAGYAVPARGYLLVWADDETAQNSSNRADLHVNFKLSKDGDAIGLFAPDGTVIDFRTFGAQATDASEGRYPDGAGSILALTQPSPRTTNSVLYPNTAPVMDAISNLTVFEGQLLLLNISAHDSDLPAQHLTFSVAPGAPANASINPDTGLFAWRPTATQAPSTNLIALCVTDDGVPPLGATTVFTVRVAPRPRITSIRLLPDANEIAFPTVPGKTYQIEFKNSLLEENWTPLGPAARAVGESVAILDEAGIGSQRFYRVVAFD
ncbi:MAG TPA: lamin tail domain-containing protein [Verrucomicrobiae bacterium]